MKINKYRVGPYINMIEEELVKTGFDGDEIDYIFECWSQSHRFYHNKMHLFELIAKIDRMSGLSDSDRSDLFVIACFHDIVYDPKKLGEKVNDRYGLLNTGWNEVESIMKFTEMVENKLQHFDSERSIRIIDAIAATGRREVPAERLACLFWSLDNEILTESFDVLLRYEREIEQEFQFAPWPQYQKSRVNFLRAEAVRLESDDLNRLADFVENRRPSVAIYPGSFNPFHKGHLDILKKAERIFDKVIIVKGVNPDKEATTTHLPEYLQFHEIIEWDGLTTDLIRDIESHSEVALLRGLRNGKDLDYEVNQIRFMEEMYPRLNVVFIQCSKDLEHVSSSAIRKIQTFSESAANKYL